jgi:hypothetical protein
MARKKATNGSSTLSNGSDVDTLPVDDKSAQEVAITETPKPVAYEPVQINNYDVKELKNTLDDALKRVCYY